MKSISSSPVLAMLGLSLASPTASAEAIIAEREAAEESEESTDD